MMNWQAKQKGTSLLELLVAMAITAMIVGGIAALIFQEYSGTATAKNSITVAHEIGNAARWISQDVMMAESTDLVEGTNPAGQVTLSWVDQSDFAYIPHSSSYYLEGTQLQRDYDGTVTTVARDISNIKFSQAGRILTVSISCTPQWWSAKKVGKTYRIYLRPAEEG
ncbi:MAG: PilW family protein [Dehalococcoidales bacterium]